MELLPHGPVVIMTLVALIPSPKHGKVVVPMVTAMFASKKMVAGTGHTIDMITTTERGGLKPSQSTDPISTGSL